MTSEVAFLPTDGIHSSYFNDKGHFLSGLFIPARSLGNFVAEAFIVRVF